MLPGSAHARIEQHVGDIDDDVGDDDEQPAEQHDADDDRPVLVVDRLHRQRADALQAVDLLDDDGAAEQQRDIGAELA